MNKNFNSKYGEELFETLLKVTAKEVVNDEIESLPHLEKLNKLHNPSKALENKIRYMLDEKTKN